MSQCNTPILRGTEDINWTTGEITERSPADLKAEGEAAKIARTMKYAFLVSGETVEPKIEHIGDGAYSVVVEQWGGVDTGHPVKVATLSGEKVDPEGYRAWILQTSPGSRYEPPDQWDETISEGLSWSACVEALVVAVATHQIQQAIRSHVEPEYGVEGV